MHDFRTTQKTKCTVRLSGFPLAVAFVLILVSSFISQSVVVCAQGGDSSSRRSTSGSDEVQNEFESLERLASRPLKLEPENLVVVVQEDLKADSGDERAKKATNWRAQRILLHREFGAEIQQLANWCRKNGIEEQVSHTFGQYRSFQLDRQYIFLPTEKRTPVAEVEGIGAEWLEKLNEVKRNHASRLFQLANRAAASGSYAVAFQLLHEVIYYDRDHQEVRRILGHKKRNDGTWQMHAEKPKKPRNSMKRHDVVAWPKQSFYTVNTPHFQIDSNATKKETEILARKLESWHYAWRLVFFDYWNRSPEVITKWMAGRGGLKIPRKRYRVIFFKDHADYVKQVAPIQKGIEVSAGYYNGDYSVSFFPATNAEGVVDEATWRHELCHQLFRESIPTRKMPFADHFLWLDEGVAMHFESLKPLEGQEQILTLGGFDSQRLQYARWRRLRENYHVPIAELAVMDMKTFQGRQDIRRLYSESAGIAHMLMDSRKYDLLPVLVEFMKLIHKRKLKPEVFEKMMGRTLEQLDEDYLEFLKVSSRDVERRIENTGTIAVLAAINAKLGDSAFDTIAVCVNLRKLDLTGTDFTKIRSIKLQRLDLLQEIYLTNCLIESGSLQSLGQLASLREIDLSSSSIDDSLLDELKKLPGLRNLILADTRVTDSGLLKIAKLSKLKYLDLTGATVTASGVAGFKQIRGDVKVIQRK